MLHISTRARWLIGLISLLLLIPVLAIRTQKKAELEQFHNRVLSPSPHRSLLLADPAKYFTEKKAWLADRAFPVILATRLYKRALFGLFKTAPEPRVTIGTEKFVFLNGSSNSQLYELFELACITTHSSETGQQIASELERMNTARSGTAIDIVLFPTLATIYPENLPASVPEKYRRACSNVRDGHSPLIALQRQHPDLFVYPLEEMLAAKKDPAFYPRANWHALGLSLKVVRDAYVHRLTQNKVTEKLVLTESSSEIIGTYGIDYRQPQYIIQNDNVSANQEENLAFSQAIASFFQRGIAETRVLDNRNPVLNNTILMLSDSFGHANSEAFAGAFERVYQVNTNELQTDKLKELIANIQNRHKIDRIVFLLQEGNSSRLMQWLNTLF